MLNFFIDIFLGGFFAKYEVEVEKMFDWFLTLN